MKQDKWTSSTGNLPRKRRNITENILNAALNTKQTKTGLITLKDVQQRVLFYSLYPAICEFKQHLRML